MAEDEQDKGGLKSLWRALPRKRLLLIAVIVLVNLSVVTYWRGHTIYLEDFTRHPVSAWGMNTGLDDLLECVPPWDWSAEEWRATWPWR